GFWPSRGLSFASTSRRRSGTDSQSPQATSGERLAATAHAQRTRASRAWRSSFIGSPFSRLSRLETAHDRLQQDLEVQHQRPVAKVVEVVIDAAPHLGEVGGLPPAAVDLRESRDAGRGFVAHHVAVDEPSILLVVRDGVGPRADEAHPTLQHVDELRQLVERVAAEKASEGGDARIVPRHLAYRVAVLGDAHRAELVDDDLLAAEPVAPLLEDDGSRSEE